MMRFGSVCSGIEAASTAWNSLGWEAAWFSEIEPFPCAVLAHHHPTVPNYGDMTLLPGRIQSGEVEAPDVFCGGTPCQAFSVAGKRHSLEDARGNLSLTFCEIANAIDDIRHDRGEQPCIVFWENVPGVLSTKDNAFGCFLAQLCGGDQPLHAPDGWPDAGCVSGERRTAAWRILDAQYFGLAQRRRRVFVVASARDGFDPAAVLFEFDGVRRDTAPSRETGEVAPTIPARSTGGGGLGTDFDCDGGVIQHRGRRKWPADIASALDTTMDKYMGCNNQHVNGGCPWFVPVTANAITALMANSCLGHNKDENVLAFDVYNQSPTGTVSKTVASRDDQDTASVILHSMQMAHALRGEGFDASEDGTGRGSPLVPVAFHPTQTPISSAEVCHSLGANENATAAVMQPIPLDLRNAGRDAEKHDEMNRQGIGVGQPGDPAHTVTSAVVHGVATAYSVRTANTSSNGWGIQHEVTHTLDATAGPAIVHGVAVGTDCYNGQITGDFAATLGTPDSSVGASGPTVMQPVPFDTTQITSAANYSNPKPGDPCHPLATGAHAPAVAFTTKLHNTTNNQAGNGSLFAQQAMQVRRLTPVECERLQGFPDNHTAIPWRGKAADQCPDGPRYKALGNSWAVPVVAWIGKRIHNHLAATK